MLSKNLLLKSVFFIALITVISGLTQMLMPKLVLTLVGGSMASPGGNHSFAIVGMFMVLFGGLCIHALSTERQEPLVMFWCALQKLGASVAVSLGVYQEFFSCLALLVAGFDFLSFILLFIFWWSIKNRKSGAY
ncbi:MAG TPA: hypothetical protein VN030_09490 [Cellvibrio sp.]|nr:hypothetical protein [Cellvibrio sp.]